MGDRDNMLEIKDFSKKYRGAKDYSVSGISLKANDGQVLGIIGSNGAGKSTTIKCITGILPFNEGTIIVNGFDVKSKSIDAKKTIGYAPDDHSMYEKLTGREYIDYMGSLFGVSKTDKQSRIDKYAKLFDIEYALDNQISSYSHGMKQKVCLIGSIIHEPKLWVLDEPMVGLDPQTTDEVKKCIRDYASANNTVLFSSHNLEIVEELCDLVAIIKKGKLIAFFSMKKAKEKEGFSLRAYYNAIYNRGGNE